MRGIPSFITDIRKKVFTEVARMAYAGERVHLAMGLGLRLVDGCHLVSEGMDAAFIAEQYSDNEDLLEGMGCPGGCVSGPGTILPVDKAVR